MENRLLFSWKLHGTGWAQCQVGHGRTEADFAVSHLSDALADVLSGVASLYGESRGARFFFDSEPQEVRWLLRRTGPDVAIDVYRFPDISVSFELAEDEGELVWSTVQSRAALSHAVLEAAETVLREHGEDGYLAEWLRYPFPISVLQDLRRLHRQDACGLPHGSPQVSRPGPAAIVGEPHTTRTFEA